LHKSFGGVPVLRDVSFTLQPGTVTVLAGENGAGKSTLFKIISGQLRADSGSVSVLGTALHAATPGTARDLGVGIVPQELAPYADLNVAENLFVGREPKSFGFVLNRTEMLRKARALLHEFDVDIDPARPMRSLSVALTQIVEIVKATSSGASVLLLDEPTSSIAEAEVERLYQIIARLRERGVAMLYTTHRMAEIQAIGDRVITLRDGSLVLDEAVAGLEPHRIVTSMIGRELGQLFPDTAPAQEQLAFRVSGMKRRKTSPSLDLSVRQGEILGIGGLVGAGRSALLNSLFGMGPVETGTFEMGGKALPARRLPRESIAAGIAFVPEDRKGFGLALGLSNLDNLTLPHLDRDALFGVLKGSARRRTGQRLAELVSLRYRGLSQPTETLSGGNQQKIVIGRWLAKPPAVLLLDEPTRGVDVGARSEIYRIITELAAGGMAVILVSSDMPELIGMSHRVLVMRGGGIAGELLRQDLDAPDSQRRIFHLASGEEAQDTTESKDQPA